MMPTSGQLLLFLSFPLGTHSSESTILHSCIALLLHLSVRIISGRAQLPSGRLASASDLIQYGEHITTQTARCTCLDPSCCEIRSILQDVAESRHVLTLIHYSGSVNAHLSPPIIVFSHKKNLDATGFEPATRRF